MGRYSSCSDRTICTRWRAIAATQATQATRVMQAIIRLREATRHRPMSRPGLYAAGI